jgi:hypothetical protein
MVLKHTRYIRIIYWRSVSLYSFIQDIVAVGIATNNNMGHKRAIVDGDMSYIKWIWELEEKVECIIDGQTLYLSRESVNELKKLK